MRYGDASYLKAVRSREPVIELAAPTPPQAKPSAPGHKVISGLIKTPDGCKMPGRTAAAYGLRSWSDPEVQSNALVTLTDDEVTRYLAARRKELESDMDGAGTAATGKPSALTTSKREGRQSAYGPPAPLQPPSGSV